VRGWASLGCRIDLEHHSGIQSHHETPVPVTAVLDRISVTVAANRYATDSPAALLLLATLTGST
jgi:hypothetical protein